jgi:PAS domain S-box-containing protein
MLHAEMPQPCGSLLSQVLSTSVDGIIFADERLRVTLFNRSAELMFGCSTTEAAGLDVSSFMPCLSSDRFPAPDTAGTAPAFMVDLTAVRSDKSHFPIRASITRTTENGVALYVLSVRDMSQALADSSRPERLGHLYVSRTRLRQTIRQSRGRQELLAAACDTLVSYSGFRMAWVGWHMPETDALVIVAEAGASQDYLAGLQVSVGDGVHGQGASGTAFREERPVTVSDLQHDFKSVPWKAKAKASGLRSSSALPIRMRGRVCGVLNVYSDAVDAFQDEEIALLVEVAADISDGLDGFADDERRDTAEAMVRRERQFSDAMVESAPGICYLFTEGGKILRWNRTFEAVSGYSADEIARMQAQDFFPLAERSLVRENLATVFRTGRAAMNGTLLHKTGVGIAHCFTAQRVMFQGIPCLIGVGVDITNLREAQTALAESELRYRTILDSILEGCELIGFDWRYKYLNDAAAVQNRRPANDFLGKTMQEAWLGTENQPVFDLVRNCMEQRVPFHDEIKFTFPDGGTGWFDLRVQPVPEGVFLLSVDITERRLAEERLRALNADLENRILLRTEELRAAVVRAEASDRTKSVFLATMSHELRTPLNSIIGFTGIMVMGLAGPLNAEQHKQLGIVQSSARHLLSLVNDVLDISKIEAGQMEVHLQSFDIAPSVEKVVASLTEMALLKGLRLTVVWDCASVTLTSDQRRFEQILLNLINNAVKFTETGSVAVHIDLDGPAPDLRIRIIDTGVGIRRDDLQSLFLPFRQIDSGMTRRHDGTGLGLAICHRLLEYLDGKIHVESEFGKGSTFTVRFPLIAKVR